MLKDTVQQSELCFPYSPLRVYAHLYVSQAGKLADAMQQSILCFDKHHSSRDVHAPDHSSSWHLETCKASAWKLVRVRFWPRYIYTCSHLVQCSIVAGLSHWARLYHMGSLSTASHDTKGMCQNRPCRIALVAPRHQSSIAPPVIPLMLCCQTP